MAPGDGLGNRQPQPRAAGLTCPAGIAAGDALKDPLLLTINNSWPVA